MKQYPPNDNRSTDEIFAKIKNDISGLYNHQLSDAEAADAARNLIGFCRIMLDVERRKWQNKTHAKCS